MQRTAHGGRRRTGTTVAAALTVTAAVATGVTLATSAPATAATTGTGTTTLGYAETDTGSLGQVSSIIGARAQWTAGNTGEGIDVAVIDTGIACGVEMMSRVPLGANIPPGTGTPRAPGWDLDMPDHSWSLASCSSRSGRSPIAS